MRVRGSHLVAACLAGCCLLGGLAQPGPREARADQSRVLYLTFDDGPTMEFTTGLLDALAKFDAHATFFQMGREAALHPRLVRRMAREGHALGNHSWSHPDLTTLTSAQVAEELAKTTAAQLGLAGPCFRPPYGDVNDVVRAVAAAQGLKVILWESDVGDWVERPVADLVADLRAATEPGAVILMHDGFGPRQNNVEAIRQMLPWWASRGYRLEAIPGCLAPAP